MRKRILTAALMLGLALLGANITVMSETSQEVVLQFSFGEYHITETNDYSYIVTQGLGYSDEVGAPTLPEVTYYIGIPENGDISVQIINSSAERVLLQKPLLPVPEITRGESISNYNWEIHKQLYNVRSDQSFRIGTPQIYRYNYVIPITITPAAYSFNNSEVFITTDLTLAVNISGATNTRNRVRDSLDLSANILNYQTARNWQMTRTADINYAPFDKSEFWYSFEIPQNGMYELTATTLAALPLADIDPRTIRIFTTGGALLTDSITDDGNPFREIPILITGEADGQFGATDKIIFYGENRDGFNKNIALSGTVNHYFNPYSANGKYWLTYGGNFPEAPKRMTENSYNQHQTVRTSSPEYYHFESENVRREHFGFTWFHSMLTGLSDTNHNFSFSLDNVDTSKPQKLTIAVQGDANAPTSSVYRLSMRVNQNTVLNRINWQGINYRTFEETSQFLQNGSNSAVITVHRTASSTLFLDYFGINYHKYLVKENRQLHFRTNAEDGNSIVLYQIRGNNNGLRAFEIKGTFQVGTLNVNSVGQGPEQLLEIAGRGEALYSVVKDGEYLSIINFKEENPRDLAVSANPIDCLIITPDEFTGYAEQLSLLYQMKEGFTTKIIRQGEIFNQFNGGMPDPNAIRLFIRHAFYNYPSDGATSSLRNVTLLGSASIDWRNFSGQAAAKNRMILFHRGTNTSDDFFVDVTGNSLPDIAIGRLTGMNDSQMAIIMNKITNYWQNPTPGLWRNTPLVVADDEFTTNYANEAIHSTQAQTITQLLSPAVITDKLMAIEYPFDPFGNKPKARDDMIEKINEGRLVWYYIGHGNYDLMGHESYFRAIDIQSLTNRDKLPLFIAASCDVGKFDYFAYNSLSERLLVHPDGGSIASLAATGLSSPSPNAGLMEVFLRKIINEYGAPGLALVEAKHQNSSQTFNNRRYAYLGDPVLPIVPPLRSNNISIANNPDSLFAYQRITIEGSFSQTQLNSIDYLQENDEIKSKTHIIGSKELINDKQSQTSINHLTTGFRGQERADIVAYSSEYGLAHTVQASDINIHYTKWGNIYFRGQSDIVSDTYTASFLVPGDIRRGKRGRILAYYFDSDTKKDYVDYYFPKVLTNIAYEHSVTDTIPPSISIWLNTENFRDGDIVNPNPTLYAHIEDESGINILGELGHKILLLMDAHSTPIDVTDGFVYHTNSYTKGNLTWQLRNLSEGKHTIQLIVFDNFNNPAVARVSFVVSRSEDIVISDVLPYPNPMSSNGSFTFKLNDNADITLTIYTLRGRRIRTLRGSGISGFNQIPWDGRDGDGDRIANNTYLYKIRARQLSSGKAAEEIGKVIIYR